VLCCPSLDAGSEHPMSSQGHGDSQKVTVPLLVEPLSHLRVTKVASYNEHTLVRKLPRSRRRELPLL
jgi:hypothetical protein